MTVNKNKETVLQNINISFLSLFFLMMFFFLGKAYAENIHVDDQNQLLEYLQEQKQYNTANTEFTCSSSLYSVLRENNFFGLYHILVKAGIDYGQTAVSYNDFRHFIQLSGLQYTDQPWAECETREDVRYAISRLSTNPDGFTLLCSVPLAEQLITGDQLRLYMTQSGVDTYYSVYSADAGIIKISGMVYFDVPYVFVEDFLQFSTAISDFCDRGIDDFYIVFDPELFARISNDPEQHTIMIGSSKLGNYRSSTDPTSCAVRYSEVEFTEVPREICRTIADVPEAIRQMGSAGIRNFELIFPDTSVFNALSQNNFEKLQSLEAEAGMSSGQISYSSSGDRIIIRDAEITANAVTLTNLRDAAAYIEAQSAEGNRSIHLFCTPNLYYDLLGDSINKYSADRTLNRIYDLTAHAGIFDYDISVSEAAHVINIYVNKYYPGTAILQALQTGNHDKLSSREMEVWHAAAAIAEKMRSPDPLQTAIGIHDWLCAHVVYREDERTDEDDNAIGAILNGAANCDGYADAFFLIGNLAGLNVRYQHGDSFQRQNDALSHAVAHMWNLLEIDGQWHMVDVTWDDEDSGWSHTWFNVGQDIAERMHIWNADMTMPLAAKTDRRIRIENEYDVWNESDLYAAVDNAYRNHQSNFRILFRNPVIYYFWQTALDIVTERCAGYMVTYSKNDRIPLLVFYDLSW